MNYGVANRSFALIHEVPGRVTRWFGASEGGDESNHVTAAIGMITKHSSGAMVTIKDGAMGGKAASNGKGSGKRRETRATNIAGQPEGGITSTAPADVDSKTKDQDTTGKV